MNRVDKYNIYNMYNDIINYYLYIHVYKMSLISLLLIYY